MDGLDRNGLFGLHCGERPPCTIIGLALLGVRWGEVEKEGKEGEAREWVEVDNVILEW